MIWKRGWTAGISPHTETLDTPHASLIYEGVNLRRAAGYNIEVDHNHADYFADKLEDVTDTGPY